MRDAFINQDAYYILKLRLSMGLRDIYIWGLSKNGVYNSQSGYKLLSSPENQDFTAPNPNLMEKELWSNIWKETMPKIRHFIWKALAGALDVADRLQSRGMDVDQVCRLCRGEICHVLFTYLTTKQTWCLSNIPAPRGGFSTNYVLLNFHYLMISSRRSNIEERI